MSYGRGLCYVDWSVADSAVAVVGSPGVGGWHECSCSPGAVDDGAVPDVPCENCVTGTYDSVVLSS